MAAARASWFLAALAGMFLRACAHKASTAIRKPRLP